MEVVKEFSDAGHSGKNINGTLDILQAIAYHDLHPAGLFTSEDAKSYKPRKELFELALKSTGLSPDEVIHIGAAIAQYRFYVKKII